MARPSLDRNVKFKRLCRELQLPKPYVRGLLETMWDCAHECGNPILGMADDVEAAAEWPGEPGAFADAVVDFLDVLPDGRYQIHDYWDHAPEYVKKRRQREQERQTRGDALSHPADNGRQRQTTARNGTTPAPAPAPAHIEEPSQSCPSQPSPSAPESVKGGRKRVATRITYQGDPAFLGFWELYPRKVGVAKAHTAMVSARKRPEYPGDETVIQKLKTLIIEDWSRRERQFIPHPATWLNRCGWEDEPDGRSWEGDRDRARRHAASGHYDDTVPIDPRLGI